MKLGKFFDFGLHTVLVYVSATRLSPMLVFRWSAWVGFSASRGYVSGGDWYLQHLVAVTIIPAFLVGYLASHWKPTASVWGWVLPSILLAIAMLLYTPERSIITGNMNTKFSYFFDVQHSMPTARNPFISDPKRVYFQMVLTAPFYAGIAYSVGALLARKWPMPQLVRLKATCGRPSSAN